MTSAFMKYLAAIAVVFLMSACGGTESGTSPVQPPLDTQPSVLEVFPTSGYDKGGDTLDIRGKHFVTGATVTIGGVNAMVTSQWSDALNHIIVTAPAHAPGVVSIVVTNPDGKSATLASAYTYVATSLTPQELARQIMGRNFFGIEEAQRYFGFTFTASELVQYYDIGYTRAVLEEKKNTHILVFIPPRVSIANIISRTPAGTVTFCDPSFLTQSAITDNTQGTLSTGTWVLMSRTSVPITGDIWSQQVSPLIPWVVWTLTGHYLASGEILFSGTTMDTESLYTPPGENGRPITASGNAFGGKVGVCSSWFTTKHSYGVDNQVAVAWKWSGKLVP